MEVESETIPTGDLSAGAIDTPDQSAEEASVVSSDGENDDQALDLDAEDEIVLDEDSTDENGGEASNPPDENAPEGTSTGDNDVTNLSSSKSRTAACPLDLPISVVRRIMKSAAGNRRVTPELISAMSRCAGVFALYLLSASQDATVASGRNSIRPVEVVRGLIACGFPEIAEEARIALDLKSSDIFARKKKTRKNVKKA